MKFYIERASFDFNSSKKPCEQVVCVDGEWQIDFSTLEQLTEWARFVNPAGGIILDRGFKSKDIMRITIYDSYIE